MFLEIKKGRFMENKYVNNVFESMHPLSVFVYFMAVCVITMFSIHPMIMVISFMSGIAVNMLQRGVRSALITLAAAVPLILLLTLTNPVFVHSGRDVLFFLLGIPVTLQALLYGLNMGVMIAAVIIHFRNYSFGMSMGKTMFLIGRILPNTALLISVTVKNIEQFGRRYLEISDAQKALGYFSEEKKSKNLIKRLKVFFVLVSCALEDSVECAVSMRAKGYGTGRRKSSLRHRFTSGDTVFVTSIAVFAGATLVLMGKGYGDFDFYPVADKISFGVPDTVMYAAFFMLTFLPVVRSLREGLRWKYLMSKI